MFCPPKGRIGRLLDPRAPSLIDARKKNKLKLGNLTFPPENGQPPCFMRFFFHVRDSTFRFAPPRKLNLSPFSPFQNWKSNPDSTLGPQKEVRGEKKIQNQQIVLNLKVEFKFNFGKSHGFKNLPEGLWVWVRSLGVRVWSLGFHIWGLGFRV